MIGTGGIGRSHLLCRHIAAHLVTWYQAPPILGAAAAQINLRPGLPLHDAECACVRVCENPMRACYPAVLCASCACQRASPAAAAAHDRSINHRPVVRPCRAPSMHAMASRRAQCCSAVQLQCSRSCSIRSGLGGLACIGGLFDIAEIWDRADPGGGILMAAVADLMIVMIGLSN